jgi:hypothetical protein
MDIKELEKQKIADLRVIAETAGIANASELKKDEIIKILVANKANEIVPSVPTENIQPESEAKKSRTRTRKVVEKTQLEPTTSLFEVTS